MCLEVALLMLHQIPGTASSPEVVGCPRSSRDQDGSRENAPQ